MHRVLFLIDRLAPGGPAKQLALVAEVLPRHRIEAHVCVLCEDGVLSAPLARTGMQTHVLHWSRPFDLTAARALSRLVRYLDPQILHAFGVPALAAARLFVTRRDASRPPCRAVVVGSPFHGGRRVGPLSRFLLPQAHRVIVPSMAQLQRCLNLGLNEEKIAVVRPAVTVPPSSSPDAVRRRLGIPATAPIAACIGPLEAHKGFYEAIWAFDILEYAYRDLRLVFFGDGSDRRRLQAAAARGRSGRIHFLEIQPCLSELLSAADLVLVPSLMDVGLNAALEGMAAGKAVVASAVPTLAEWITHGRTGLLTRPGEVTALAKQIGVLLSDAALRQRLGQAAQSAVLSRHTSSQMAGSLLGVYEALAPASSAVHRRQIA